MFSSCILQNSRRFSFIPFLTEKHIEMELARKRLENIYQSMDRSGRMKRLKEQGCLATAKEAQKKLWEQQKKCSFNNPILHKIPPLPPPPVTRVYRVKLASVPSTRYRAHVTPEASQENHEDEEKSPLMGESE